jgi:hypothetical protein
VSVAMKLLVVSLRRRLSGIILPALRNPLRATVWIGGRRERLLLLRHGGTRRRSLLPLVWASGSYYQPVAEEGGDASYGP